MRNAARGYGNDLPVVHKEYDFYKLCLYSQLLVHWPPTVLLLHGIALLLLLLHQLRLKLRLRHMRRVISLSISMNIYIYSTGS